MRSRNHEYVKMTLEINNLKHLRETVTRWRAGGERVAFVPTMGALHIGHLALVKAAQVQADRVVVSIFVNPTQFGPNEDFSRYPRPRDADVKLLREAGASAVWLPTVEEMYPEGFSTSVKAGSASTGLDGDFRPGHFDGVATVVTKLLLQVMPDVALFGPKDYQQLCVIKQLVADLNIPVRIEGVATVREVDGLAFSSRNQYLNEAERAIAPKLYHVLVELASALKHSLAVIPAKAVVHVKKTDPFLNLPDASIHMDPGLRRDGSVEALLENAKTQLLAAGFTRIDYLELRAEDTLTPLSTATASARLLAAVWLGKTRLIDNVTL
jgi:pantoate--beta-alanine ligase